MPFIGGWFGSSGTHSETGCRNKRTGTGSLAKHIGLTITVSRSKCIINGNKKRNELKGTEINGRDVEIWESRNF